MSPRRLKKEPIIGSEGLQRNLRRRAVLHRYDQKPRHVEGTIHQDENGFYLRDGRHYRIETGHRVGLYPRGSDTLRFYDVVL